MRYISWFSCGAASAVATKLAIAEYNDIDIVYCEVIEEHPDNKRFLKDCEKWFGQKVKILGNDKYNRSIYEVFKKKSYISGIGGAPCTGELKKSVRIEYERFDDVQIMGYTAEEQGRYDSFIDANPDVNLIAPLLDKGVGKSDCLAMIENAGISLPAMYLLGYHNNNCRGCCKSSSPAYWLKIEIDFNSYWKKMNSEEIRLGVSICKIDMKTVKKYHKEVYEKLGKPDVTSKTGGAVYWRPRLHEIPKNIKPMDDTIDIQCGIFCELAEMEYEDIRNPSHYRDY